MTSAPPIQNKAGSDYVAVDPAASFAITPRGTWRFLGAVLGMIAIAIAIMSFMPFTRSQSATGWVAPVGGIVRVTADTPGRIHQLLVSEGDVVSAGKAVVELSPTADFERGEVAAAMKASAVDRQAAEEVRFSVEDEARRAKAVQLQAKLVNLSTDSMYLERQVALTETQVRLRQELVSRIERLEESGYAAATTVVQRRVELLSQQQQLEAARLAVANHNRQVEATQAELIQVQLERRSAEAGQQALRRRADEELITIESGGRSVYRSSTDAMVVALPQSIGQSVAVGGVIAVLAPRNAPLEAEVFVPPTSAGFLKVGQEVRVKYDAYPYREYGTGVGSVVSISATVLTPKDLGAIGLNISEPVVRVRVALKSLTVRAAGEDRSVRPGMTLSADFVTDRQPLGLALFRMLVPKGDRR